MLKQSLCALGIIGLVAACGDTPSKKTPRAADNTPTYVPIAAPVGSFTATGASTGSTGSTALSGATAAGASAAGAPAFALTSVQSTTWESNCYRFSATGDFSKKYWSFSADAMVSLLVKFTDAACTAPTKNTDGTAKVWSTWIVGSLAAAPLVDNWAVVTGTCTKGCTAEYKSAFRASATVLNEGSKIGTAVPESYNTGEGKYVSFSKSTKSLDLEVLATTLSSGAAVPVNGGTVPVTPTTPPVVSQVESTGLGLIGSLAGQSWDSCYVSKNTEADVKVDRGFKRRLTFSKGADLKADSYQSGLTVYTNLDCTGDVLSTKAPYTFSNLVVAPAPQEGWILVTTQTCATNCSAVKSLMKLPTATEGLAEAGENKTAGTFYIETPRHYTLAQ